jgi:hypothetical protein
MGKNTGHFLQTVELIYGFGRADMSIHMLYFIFEMEVDTCPLHQIDAHTIYYYIILQT